MKYPVTPDGRYFVHKERLWRCTNPNLDEETRQRLVNQLMKHLVWRWREEYPGIQIKIRQSHRGWMRQYNVKDGKPIPFDSKAAAAYRVCMQKTCTQLYRAMLWKCPALAYFNQVEAKLKLHHLPQWQPFRDYQACPPDASDDEVHRFLQRKAILQCGLCPSSHNKFVHPNPLQRSVLR